MLKLSKLKLVLAVTSSLAMTALAHGESSAWLDIALDEKGHVTEAVVVGDVHPALVEPLRDWVTRQAFTPAAVEGQAVPSTTSVWATFTLVEVDGGYELQVLGYDSGPRPIHKEAPSYPYNELLAGKPGWVNLGFTVQPDGKASDIRVLESSHRNFRKPAQRAMAKWRFKPNTVDGRAVATEVTQKIEFVLE
jgi:TonB family protein